MSVPVIVLTFAGPGGQPLSLANLDANFAAIVAAINGLAAEPLLQLGVTPGVYSGYMPVTGGNFQGQITAPSILVGPVGGTQYAVVTTNDAATEATRGVVKKAAAVSNVATANADATYGQPEADLINELKTQVNALLAALRSAGSITT